MAARLRPKAALTMPIRVRLNRGLVERRMSPSELADQVGVTQANLLILKTGQARDLPR